MGVADSFAVPAFAPSRLKNTGTPSAAAGEVTRLPRHTRSRKYASCFVHASHTAFREKTPCRLEQASQSRHCAGDGCFAATFFFPRLYVIFEVSSIGGIVFVHRRRASVFRELVPKHRFFRLRW